MKKRFSLLCPLLAFVMIVSSFAFPVWAGDAAVEFIMTADEAVPGEDVIVNLSVANTDFLVDGLVLYNLSYDAEVFEFVGFEDFGNLVKENVTGAYAVNQSTHVINLGYSPAKVAQGEICSLRFHVSENAVPGSSHVIEMVGNASKDRKPVSGTVVSPQVSVKIKQELPPARLITVNSSHEFSVCFLGQVRNYNTDLIYSFDFGETITLTAVDTDKFAYWKNSANVIVSRTPEFTFTVTTNETYTAVYNNKMSGKVLLSFESLLGQVMARAQVDADDIDTFRFPGVPARVMYTPVGWEYDSEKLKEKIIEALATPDESDDVIVVKPVYALTETAKTVTVVGGSGSGMYDPEYQLTVTPNQPAAGMKFSHWTDEDGQIVSYREKYLFYVMRDITLTAVFVPENTPVSPVGIAQIIDVIHYEADNKLSFISFANVPDGFQMKNAGVIATSDAAIGMDPSQFTTDTATYVRGNQPVSTAYRYTWTKSNVGSSVWYVRAFVIYTDQNGTMHTVYGDIVSAGL